MSAAFGINIAVHGDAFGTVSRRLILQFVIEDGLGTFFVDNFFSHNYYPSHKRKTTYLKLLYFPGSRQELLDLLQGQRWMLLLRAWRDLLDGQS
jgi:hypothetical protein